MARNIYEAAPGVFYALRNNKTGEYIRGQGQGGRLIKAPALYEARMRAHHARSMRPEVEDPADWEAVPVRVVPAEQDKREQAERLREAMELARAVLAQSIAAGHNVPGPTPEDIEKAFWALDAAITASDAKPRANEKKGQ